MNFAKSFSLVAVTLLALAAPARGQDTSQSAPPRAYLIGVGGAAFDVTFEKPTGTFAAEYGERVIPDVMAFANFSYVNDLMSDRMRDNLQLAGAALTAQDGLPWDFSGRDRGLAFTVGAKFLMPVNLSVRPYVGGGLGVLNLKRRIAERDLGDVSNVFFELTGLNDGVINAGETAATMPLAEILLGVGGAVGRTYVDVAYRYRKAFHSFEPIEFGQLTFGVGVAF